MANFSDVYASPAARWSYQRLLQARRRPVFDLLARPASNTPPMCQAADAVVTEAPCPVLSTKTEVPLPAQLKAKLRLIPQSLESPGRCMRGCANQMAPGPQPRQNRLSLCCAASARAFRLSHLQAQRGVGFFGTWFACRKNVQGTACRCWRAEDRKTSSAVNAAADTPAIVAGAWPLFVANPGICRTSRTAVRLHFASADVGGRILLHCHRRSWWPVVE